MNDIYTIEFKVSSHWRLLPFPEKHLQRGFAHLKEKIHTTRNTCIIHLCNDSMMKKKEGKGYAENSTQSE